MKKRETNGKDNMADRVLHLLLPNTVNLYDHKTTHRFLVSCLKVLFHCIASVCLDTVGLPLYHGDRPETLDTTQVKCRFFTCKIQAAFTGNTLKYTHGTKEKEAKTSF